MNWLDYVLIAVLGFSAVRSFMRGFSREVIGLCAAIAALVLGMWFYPVQPVRSCEPGSLQTGQPTSSAF